MLLIFFSKPDDPQSQRLENETFSSPDVQGKCKDSFAFACRWTAS